MARKVNQEITAMYLIKKLKAGETVEMINRPMSLKILSAIIKKIGHLNVVTEQAKLIVSKPLISKESGLTLEELRGYCNERGRFIYPHAISPGTYEIIVERHGMTEVQPGTYRELPKDTDEKWWKVIKILYEHEYHNLKSIENEQKKN